MLGLVNTVKAENLVSTTYILGGKYNDVKTVGNYAYIAAETGLKIIDISTPDKTELIGSYDTNYSARSIDILGDKAYLTTGNHLDIINISTPQTQHS